MQVLLVPSLIVAMVVDQSDPEKMASSAGLVLAAQYLAS
jgi:hypothetical protein